MSKNRIEITGTIDRYGFGSNYVKWQLQNCTDGPVTLSINSYGGDVNEAISIGNMIADHGQVTVEYIAFNASAATLIGLYAAKSRISSDAMFMIHKSMVWVDAWGSMNEDDIDQAIEDLKEKKEMAYASTLMLAKCYSDKSGKPVSDILNMMKEAKWMNAQEALEAGFVDEVIESKCKKKAKVSNSVAALFAANGCPLPDDAVDNDDSDDEQQSLLDKMVSNLKKFPKKKITNSNTEKMDKQFTHLNQILNVEGLSVQNNSVTLTVDQIKIFNQALNDASVHKINHSAVIAALEGIDDTVKSAKTDAEKIEAVKNLIEQKPGTLPSNQSGNDKHDTELGYEPDEINNYFNQ